MKDKFKILIGTASDVQYQLNQLQKDNMDYHVEIKGMSSTDNMTVVCIELIKV